MAIHHDSPENSPDFLVYSKNKKSGGRRLNKRPLIILVVISMVIVLILSYSYHSKIKMSDGKRQEKSRSGERSAEPAKPIQLFVEASLPKVDNTTQLSSQQINHPEPASIRDKEQQMKNEESVKIRPKGWDNYEKEMEKVRAQKQEALLAALDAPTTVNSSTQQQPSPNQTTLYESNSNTKVQNPGLGIEQGADPNKQGHKQAWLAQKTSASTYLTETRQQPLSPFEVKAGTVIPSTMISGINSDLPGQLIAQVSQNVYDTATGQYLLIPQGSRLVGIYDNGVSFGQERVLVAWNRIIYPDASSLSLGMMPGSDQGGYAGFKDKVNNHYGRIFGSAVLMSLFSAGIQLSQPQASNGENYSSSQIIAASLGQQMGDLGMDMARRGLDIAPTIEIRPGYNFNVMVTKDIILKPWRGNR